MSNLLFWLALPLVAAPWLARSHRIGGALGQLAIAGLGIAALLQGAGTLDPVDLRTIAAASPHDAWFVGMTAGALIAGACLLPDPGNWRRLIPALPLAVTLGFVALPHLASLLAGLGIGALPTLIGTLLRRRPLALMEEAQRGNAPDVISLALAGAALLAAVLAPAALALSALIALIWRQWLCQRNEGAFAVPVLQVIATLLLAGWTWFLLTITGSLLPSLLGIAREAPISPAASQALALLAIGWAIAIAAPWPLDRLMRTAVQLPVAAVVIHLASAHVAPDGMAHWQPVLTTVLVASALGAVVARRWDGVAGAMVLLSATRGGTVPLIGAMVMAIVPAVRHARIPSRLASVAAAAGLALVIASTLADEVLLSVLLAFSIAALLYGADDVVAGVSAPVHL